MERDFRTELRNARIQYQDVAVSGHAVRVTLKNPPRPRRRARRSSPTTRSSRSPPTRRSRAP
jgi:hypothetical protein